MVADPFGEREAEVHTPTTGIVIGRINLPLVNEGEALFHIARLEPGAEAGAEALTTLIPDLEEARATETPRSRRWGNAFKLIGWRLDPEGTRAICEPGPFSSRKGASLDVGGRFPLEEGGSVTANATGLLQWQRRDPKTLPTRRAATSRRSCRLA